MFVKVKGNYLSSKVSEMDGKKFYSVALLSGDETVRIKFNDPAVKPLFDECQQLSRMDEVELDCEMTFFDKKLNFKAIV